MSQLKRTMDDFFDFSTPPPERIVINGGATGGVFKQEEDFIETEPKRIRLGTDYSVPPQKEQEEGMSDAYRRGHLVYSDDAEAEAEAQWKWSEEKMEKMKTVYKRYRFFGDQMHSRHLKIHESRDLIMDRISKNSVVIIHGETGCGKTTQVPQFILEDAYLRREYVNVVVTQPRRIAAMSIAERVSRERECHNGTLVGFKVGRDQDRNVSEDTCLTFCTTGVLLRQMIATRRMSQFTHIIIDEVHEREIETDFLLILVRKFLTTNSPRTKVILMSATIQTQHFAEYFSIRKSEDVTSLAPTVELGVERSFELTYYYLDDLENFGAGRIFTDINNAVIIPQMYELASNVILSICDRYLQKRKPTTFLVFLPGLYEIRQMNKIFWERFRGIITQLRETDIEIHLLHSALSSVNQMSVFTSQQSKALFRIVLSTNIAESSITVPGVEFVIDFCLVKQVAVDTSSNCSSLRMVWASRSSCVQRAGRAGRVSSGYVYRLVRQQFYQKAMQDEDEPEMRRCPLENVVLSTKLLDQGSPAEILGLAMNPPDLRDIHNTVLKLKEVGALKFTVQDVDGVDQFCVEDGDLTFVGRVMSELPLDVHCSRLILLGHLFNVLPETVIMAAGVSVGKIFLNVKERSIRPYTRRLMWADASGSDLFAILNAYTYWEQCLANGETHAAQQVAHQRLLNSNGLGEMKDLIEEIIRRLEKMNIKPNSSEGSLQHSDRDKAMALKVCIAGAFYPFYFLRRSTVSYEHKERDAYCDLNGCDPCSTIYFRGMRENRYGYLYTNQIKEYFREHGVVSSTNDLKVSFDRGRQKVFVTFFGKQETIDSGAQDGSFQSDWVPGRLSTQVYKALRLHREKIILNVFVLPEAMAAPYAREIEEKLIVKYPELCVLPEVDERSLLGVVGCIQHPNQFWLRPQEDPPYSEISSLLNRGQYEESHQLRPARDRELRQGRIVAVYEESETDCEKYFRGKIMAEIRYVGAVHPCYQVHLIDVGSTKVFPVTHLFSLERITIERRDLNLADGPPIPISDIPPRAFECTLSGIQPSYVISPKGKWTPDAVAKFRELIPPSGLVKAEFYSVYYPGVASVTLRTPTVNINDALVRLELAQRCEENYPSKLDHAKRVTLTNDMPRAPEDLGRRRLRQITEDYKMYLLDYFEPEVDTPPFGRGSYKISLYGPNSPLEATLHSASHIARNAIVRVDPESVNSIVLDTDPQDPSERLYVAAGVDKQPGSLEVRLRNTTIMPQIHGFPAIMAMIFCPKAELRRDDDKTRMNSVLCGLGADQDGRSIFPEHDLLLQFDTHFDILDFERINTIRLIMSRIYDVDTSIDTTFDVDDAQLTTAQTRIWRELWTLLVRQRKFVDVRATDREHCWGLVELLHPEELLETKKTQGALFQTLDIPKLEPEDPVKIKLMRDHAEELHQRALTGGNLQRRGIRCDLCNMILEGYKSLKTHLYTKLHLDRERQINYRPPHLQRPQR